MTKKIHTLISLLLLTIFSMNVVSAYEVKTIDGLELKNDFVLNQAKVEVELDPGSTITKNIELVNRTNKERVFKVSVEDTSGSNDGSSAVNLYGAVDGPYSLRHYISPELKEFILAPRQQMTLPIKITIPTNAEPGGKYGTVLVESSSNGDVGNTGGARTISRLGALFFVKINGRITEGGQLEDFSTSKSVFLKNENPISFNISYKNTGNVHTNPYGLVTIKNIYGADVAHIEVKPYYAMPKSLRKNTVSWSHTPLFGKYTATLELNRGYGDKVDTISTTLWFIPWLWILIALVILFVLVGLYKMFMFRFELKKK